VFVTEQTRRGLPGIVECLSPDFDHEHFSLPGEPFGGFSFWLVDAKQGVDGLFLRRGTDEQGIREAANHLPSRTAGGCDERGTLILVR
jgi:hypothetical protein